PTTASTATKTATATRTPIPGSGFSLGLDGATGYAEAPTSGELNATGDWTVEAWFRDDDPGGFSHENRTILSKGADPLISAEAPYLLQLGHSNIIAGVRTGRRNYLITFDLGYAG